MKHPPCAEYFVGTVDGELVCYVAVCPCFQTKGYRATRLVVMPEWQGAGVGTAFLNEIMQYHLEGNGRCQRKYPTYFHTSHPQLCGYMRNSKKWIQVSARLTGDNKARSIKSLQNTSVGIGEKKKSSLAVLVAILEQYRDLNILEMKKFKVFISGQKYFAEEVLRLCQKLDIEIVGVCCPLDDKYIGKAARLWNIPIIPAGMLCADNMPDCDLGITAHSFDYIGKKTRYIPRLGWLGYHPSLLPRHRGRSSIEWAIRMKEPITGGTVFWLNAGIDRGDIAYQDWCWIPPESYLSPQKSASSLWRDTLLPMGLKLFESALKDILIGVIKRKPQDKRYSTFEPDTNVKDIYKPDLLMIDYKNGHI